MSPSAAKTLLETLANGVDPKTGEVFSEDSAFNHPPVIRALFLACDALEHLENREKQAQALPENAGKAWSDTEDEQLKAAFSAGASAKDLVAQHGRTAGAISSRLVRLGLINIG